MYSDDRNWRSYQLGSPIRTSPDHRLLASPRGFSQLATSFFAYLRQGIHTHALSSLTIKLTPKPQSLVLFVHVFASAPPPAVFSLHRLQACATYRQVRTCCSVQRLYVHRRSDALSHCTVPVRYSIVKDRYYKLVGLRNEPNPIFGHLVRFYGGPG